MPTARAAILLVLVAATASAADWLWWEGEDAAESTFVDKSFDAAQYGARRDGLSGGRWLSTGGTVPQGGHHATWRVDVPAAGTYRLWARKFWKHGPFRWRFGDGEWRACGADIGLVDSHELVSRP